CDEGSTLQVRSFPLAGGSMSLAQMAGRVVGTDRARSREVLSAVRRRASFALVIVAMLWTSQSLSAAGAQVFTATLTGAQQVPPVSTTATGTGTVLLNAAETQITVNLTFSGLSTPAVAAHIHGPAPSGSNADILFDFASVVPAATSGSIPQQTF